MSKSVMIIDTPIDCCDCPFGTMAFGKGICLLDEGNGIDCPLKPYDNFIPIEWMKSWAMKNWVKTGKNEFDIIISKMIDDWLEERK